MHTPSSLLQSNAQKSAKVSANIKRRHELRGLSPDDLTPDKESELKQLNGFLQAYDAHDEKVTSPVLASHPSLFPMHTPSSLLQSNAQRSANIKRRNELYELSANGLTSKEEKAELEELNDFLESYDASHEKVISLVLASHPPLSFPCTLLPRSSIPTRTAKRIHQTPTRAI